MSEHHWLGPYKDAATALNELRKSVAEIIGADPETWPDNGNAPLAIAATLALARRAAAQITPEQLSRAMRPDIWADDGQSDNDVVSIARATHLRWAEDAISRLDALPSEPEGELQAERQRRSWARGEMRIADASAAVEMVDKAAAAYPAASRPGARVKKLEWRDEEPGISTLYTRIADSIFGRYAVTPINGGAYLNDKLIISDESAEAAAQADYERRSLSTLEPSSTTPPLRPTHRHVKRGSEYRVIGEAEAQVSTGDYRPDWTIERRIADGDRLTVYQGTDSKLWARFSDEFNDGRFVAIEAEA